MALLGQRSVGYQLGLVGIAVCFVLHFIGYVSPYWTVADAGTSSGNQGLWMLCYQTEHTSDCISFSFSSLEAWFHAVRSMESLGFAFMLGSLIYGLVVNCCRAAPTHARNLEGFALTGGLLAFIGAMIFLGKEQDTANPHNIRKLGWAFYLVAVGSAGAVVASIVVFVANKPLDAPPTGVIIQRGAMPSAVVIQTHGSTTAPGVQSAYSNAGFNARSAPPQAGYPYKS